MMKRTLASRAWLAVAGLLLGGCQGYEITQSNVFSDDDGNIVQIDYGRSDSDHVNMFVNPANGKEVEFRSKLVVRVTLPDDDTFTAWQCMNFKRSGTMYRSDDETWMVHANGFTCFIYRQLEDVPTDYREVYRGVLCETPQRSTRESKWKAKKMTSGIMRNDPGANKKK